MEGGLLVLVVLCLLPAVHSVSLPPVTRAASARSQLISQAVAHYNEGSGSKSVFLLLVDEDGKTEEPSAPHEEPPEETPAPHEEPPGPQEVRFTIKETVCKKSEYKMEERCEYKVGGVEKRCRATLKENHFTVFCAETAGGTNQDGGFVGKSSEGEHGNQNGHRPPSRERAVVIEEKRVNPGGGGSEEEEEVTPEDEDYDYFLPDTVIEFHHDDRDEEAEHRPERENPGLFHGERGNPGLFHGERENPGLFHGDILGRLLCLKCIIDIFPR
ncbi:uncharacterized protein ACMZJ9_008859 [Mantella aurantiaca]